MRSFPRIEFSFVKKKLSSGIINGDDTQLSITYLIEVYSESF